MRLCRSGTRPRRGATLVEFALVLSLMSLLSFGTIVLGAGVFRYQQVAAVAREGARWASVHGMQYQRDTKQTAATAQDVYNNAIKPMTAGLDLNKLAYSVSWSTSNE